MARPGLLRHRKFIRLARLLGSEALALGHLEIIWQAAYEAGDSNLGTGDDLEYLARWNGEQGQLTSFLLESGFVDKHENGSLIIHDLIDHAPDYVQKRMEREEERRKKGKSLSELRSKAGKKGSLAKRGKQVSSKCPANEIHLLPGTEANVRTPAPAPSPAPSPAPLKEDQSQNVDFELTPEGLSQFWVSRMQGALKYKQNVYQLSEEFSEWIRVKATTPEKLRDEIAREGRDRTEPIWDLKKRLAKSVPESVREMAAQALAKKGLV